MRYPPPVKALLPLLKTPVHPRPIGTVQGVQACAKSAFFLLLLLPGVYRVPACACIPYILSAGGRAADSESVGIDSRRCGRTGRASKRRRRWCGWERTPECRGCAERKGRSRWYQGV